MKQLLFAVPLAFALAACSSTPKQSSAPSVPPQAELESNWLCDTLPDLTPGCGDYNKRKAAAKAKAEADAKAREAELQKFRRMEEEVAAKKSPPPPVPTAPAPKPSAGEVKPSATTVDPGIISAEQRVANIARCKGKKGATFCWSKFGTNPYAGLPGPALAQAKSKGEAWTEHVQQKFLTLIADGRKVETVLQKGDNFDWMAYGKGTGKGIVVYEVVANWSDGETHKAETYSIVDGGYLYTLYRPDCNNWSGRRVKLPEAPKPAEPAKPAAKAEPAKVSETPKACPSDKRLFRVNLFNKKAPVAGITWKGVPENVSVSACLQQAAKQFGSASAFSRSECTLKILVAEKATGERTKQVRPWRTTGEVPVTVATLKGDGSIDRELGKVAVQGGYLEWVGRYADISGKELTFVFSELKAPFVLHSPVKNKTDRMEIRVPPAEFEKTHCFYDVSGVVEDTKTPPAKPVASKPAYLRSGESRT